MHTDSGIMHGQQNLFRRLIVDEYPKDLEAAGHQRAVILDALLELSPSAATDEAIAFLSDTLNFVNELGSGDYLASALKAWNATQARATVERSLAAGCVGVICMNAALLHLRFSPSATSNVKATELLCKPFFEGPSNPTGRALHTIHAPRELQEAILARGLAELTPSDDWSPSAHEWFALDPTSFSFHCSGTTSAILCANLLREDGSGYRDERIVKCVLFPWNAIRAISLATSQYAQDYGKARIPTNRVVSPYASSSAWITMEYQPGETLRKAQESIVTQADRLQFAALMAGEICASLGSVAEIRTSEPGTPDEYPFTRHFDLSPNNIILDEEGTAHLIDFGANFLYSRQIGIAEHDDSVYVAPEVKNRGTSPLADVYSLGIILIEILAGAPPRDGRVPDGVYETFPTVAVVLDDMIEEKWPLRVLAQRSGGEFDYNVLALRLSEAFELASAEPASSKRQS